MCEPPFLGHIDMIYDMTISKLFVLSIHKNINIKATRLIAEEGKAQIYLKVEMLKNSFHKKKGKKGGKKESKTSENMEESKEQSKEVNTQ